MARVSVRAAVVLFTCCSLAGTVRLKRTSRKAMAPTEVGRWERGILPEKTICEITEGAKAGSFVYRQDKMKGYGFTRKKVGVFTAELTRQGTTLVGDCYLEETGKKLARVMFKLLGENQMESRFMKEGDSEYDPEPMSWSRRIIPDPAEMSTIDWCALDRDIKIEATANGNRSKYLKQPCETHADCCQEPFGCGLQMDVNLVYNGRAMHGLVCAETIHGGGKQCLFCKGEEDCYISNDNALSNLFVPGLGGIPEAIARNFEKEPCAAPWHCVRQYTNVPFECKDQSVRSVI